VVVGLIGSHYHDHQAQWLPFGHHLRCDFDVSPQMNHRGVLDTALDIICLDTGRASLQIEFLCGCGKLDQEKTANDEELHGKQPSL
jgi:hypothetical protein